MTGGQILEWDQGGSRESASLVIMPMKRWWFHRKLRWKIRKCLHWLKLHALRCRNFYIKKLFSGQICEILARFTGSSASLPCWEALGNWYSRENQPKDINTWDVEYHVPEATSSLLRTIEGAHYPNGCAFHGGGNVTNRSQPRFDLGTQSTFQINVVRIIGPSSDAAKSSNQPNAFKCDVGMCDLS